MRFSINVPNFGDTTDAAVLAERTGPPRSCGAPARGRRVSV